MAFVGEVDLVMGRHSASEPNEPGVRPAYAAFPYK
jgi:hypothetical protein